MMGENLTDIAVGVVFFGALIILAVIGGGLLQRSARARNRRALAPLASVINGSIESDHKSAWMAGQYRGRTVQVRVTPGRNIAEASDESIKVNSFEIYLPAVPGAHSWEIARTGLIKKQWTAKSSDGALQGRLAQSDLLPRLPKAGRYTSMRYAAREQSLQWHEDVQPRRAPKPQAFRRGLDLLLHAVDVNGKINPPGS